MLGRARFTSHRRVERRLFAGAVGIVIALGLVLAGSPRVPTAGLSASVGSSADGQDPSRGAAREPDASPLAPPDPKVPGSSAAGMSDVTRHDPRSVDLGATITGPLQEPGMARQDSEGALL